MAPGTVQSCAVMHDIVTTKIGECCWRRGWCGRPHDHFARMRNKGTGRWQGRRAAGVAWADVAELMHSHRIADHGLAIPDALGRVGIDAADLCRRAQIEKGRRYIVLRRDELARQHKAKRQRDQAQRVVAGAAIVVGGECLYLFQDLLGRRTPADTAIVSLYVVATMINSCRHRP